MGLMQGEHGCEVFDAQATFLSKFDKPLHFSKMLLHLDFELLLSVFHMHFSCAVGLDFAW